MSNPQVNKDLDFIINNLEEYLTFIKSKFVFIHNSNFFFRDLHYATKMFLEEHLIKTSYHKAEIVAREIGLILVQRNIFKTIDHQSWMLNYPKFALPKVEKKVA
ncbi:MAG: hypothetical protein HZB59_05670 [Ignavibacteriales bacterium]|nr:hypothetical protein [Ignavibacteriales bacterium]